MADSEEVVVVFCNIPRRKSPSGPSASKMSCTDEGVQWGDVLFNYSNNNHFKDAAHIMINHILSSLGKEGENISLLNHCFKQVS